MNRSRETGRRPSRAPCDRSGAARAVARRLGSTSGSTTGSTIIDAGQNEQLVSTLRATAHELGDRRGVRDLEGTLGRVVAAAVRTVPGVAGASTSVDEAGHVRTRHPTSAAVRRVDDAQVEVGEGPCLSVLADPFDGGLVVAQDFAGHDGTRWPSFGPRAVAAGFRGLLSTSLTTQGGFRAALNLYAVDPDVFDERAQTVAGLFGLQATLLLHGAQHVAHLQRALDSRDLIGRAKGILAERFGVDDDSAFRMLTESSQETNMKLTAVARWLTGDTAIGGPTGAGPDRVDSPGLRPDLDG